MRREYRIGTWRVRPELNRLESETGEVRDLEPKTMDVLSCLLEQAGEVLSSEQILDVVWPKGYGDIGMVKKRIAQIRNALGDDARHPKYIETLNKRGYRIIAPVRSQAHVAGSTTDTSHRTSPTHGLSRYRMIGALVVLVATGVLVWQFLTNIEDVPPARLSQQITMWLAPFDKPTALVLGADVLVHNRDQLQSALLNTRSIKFTDDPLEADFKLEGTVEEANGDLQTRLRLTDVQRSIPLWEHTFMQTGRDGEFVQASLAASLLSTISYWLVVHQTMIERDFLQHADAIDEFTYGQIEWHAFVLGAGGNPLVAVEHFKAALRLEPTFWLPQLQLTILYANRLGPPVNYAEHVRRTHQAVRRTLELRRLHGKIVADDMVWEGAVAIASQRLELDYAFSEQMWHAARDRGWNAGVVYSELAGIAAAQGELERAIRYYQAARSGDAKINQTAAATWLGYTLIAADQLPRAREVLGDAALTLPNQGAIPIYTHVLNVFTMLLQKDPGAAAALRQAWQRYGGEEPILFAGILALAGMEQEARAVLASLEKLYQSGVSRRNWHGVIGHLFLGELDQAFVWLNRAVENREVNHFSHLRHASYLDPMRVDPRFDRVLERLRELEGVPSALRQIVAEHEDALRSSHPTVE